MVNGQTGVIDGFGGGWGGGVKNHLSGGGGVNGQTGVVNGQTEVVNGQTGEGSGGGGNPSTTMQVKIPTH